MPTHWSLDAQFVKAVHTALKRLHRDQELSLHPLTQLAEVESRCRRNGWPDTSLGRAASLRHTLDEALQVLAVQDATAASLLEHHFWQGETVVRLARERHIAESTLYARQERALHALARILWSMEQAARENADARKGHLARNLPSPTYRRLFGRDEILARLCAELTDDLGPWLVCLEGLAGLGKTALAHRCATWAVDSTRFADIVWVTAQQQRFTIWSGIVAKPETHSALTFESLLDDIAQQLGHEHLRGKPLAQKEAFLRATLRQASYLVIVDNVEAAADPHTLASELRKFATPTRFLFTSCHSLCDHSGVLCLTLNELTEADSIQLIRSEGAERGISTITEADDAALCQIYRVTGGNPLAIKLVVGQTRSLPLDSALHRLRGARDRRSEDLYWFIYRQSWKLLSSAARQVLLTLPSTSDSGGRWEDLLATSGLPENKLERAVQELASMSLLNVGGVEKKRYAIHQLTYTFITSGVLERWTQVDQVLANHQASSVH
jgi:hypothetical protein